MTATATCLNGVVLAGGGRTIQPSVGAGQVIVRDSFPSDSAGSPVASGAQADSWTVTAVVINADTDGGTGSVTAYAVCGQ